MRQVYVTRPAPEPENQRYSRTSVAVWHYMRLAGGEHTTNDLQAKLGVSRRTIERAFAHLATNRHIVKHEVMLGAYGERCSWLLQKTLHDEALVDHSVPSFDHEPIPSNDHSVPSKPEDHGRAVRREAIGLTVRSDRDCEALTRGNEAFDGTREGGAPRESEDVVRICPEEPRVGRIHTLSATKGHMKTDARTREADRPTSLATLGEFEVDSILAVYTETLALHGMESPQYWNRIRACLDDALDRQDRSRVEDAVARLFEVDENGNRRCRAPFVPDVFVKGVGINLGFRRDYREGRDPMAERMSERHDELMGKPNPAEAPAVPELQPGQTHAESLRKKRDELLAKRTVQPSQTRRSMDDDQRERLDALARKNAWRVAKFDARHPRNLAG